MPLLGAGVKYRLWKLTRTDHRLCPGAADGSKGYNQGVVGVCVCVCER